MMAEGTTRGGGRRCRGRVGSSRKSRGETKGRVDGGMDACESANTRINDNKQRTTTTTITTITAITTTTRKATTSGERTTAITNNNNSNKNNNNNK